MKKILIFGASGLTGFKTIMLAKSRDFDVYGSFNARKIPLDILKDNSGTFFALDLRNDNSNDGLEKSFREIRPDIVVNCTALHNVDYCELNPQEAYFINSQIVGNVAKLCNKFGSRLIHISTDFVFDGEKTSAYVETDKPNPINLYAKSKLAGENEAMQD